MKNVQHKSISKPVFDKTISLKHYLDLSLDMFCICDLNGKIVYVNPSFQDGTGYDLEDIEGKLFLRLVYEKDLSKMIRILSCFKKDKAPISLLQTRFVIKDDYVKWFSWNITYDEQQGLVYFSGREVTKFYEEKEKLRFFSTAFDKAQDAILIAKNIGTFENPIPAITYINQNFLNYSGYSIDEVIGQNPKMMRGKNDNKATVAKMKAALKNWEPINVEVKNQTKSGKNIWVSLSISPIANEEGVYTHWISIQKDITERVRKEERLRIFESIVKNSKDSVIITEAEPINYPDGPQILYVNEAFCELTGYTKEEAMGNTPGMLQGAETSIEATNNIKNGLKNWQPIQQDILNYKKNGEPFWVDLSIVPVADKKGWFTHWVSIQRDITERVKQKKRLEEKVTERTKALEHSNRKLEAFASIASHDLKAPLRMITSYLELLKKGAIKKLGEDVLWTIYKQEMEYLTFAQQGGIDAYNLIQGVLEYSQIKSAEEDSWVIIDLNERINTVLLLLKRDIEIAQAKVTFEPMPKIKGNALQIQQLFQNLIANALKFRSERPCQIKIEVEKYKKGYLFSIKDNGIGMAEEDLELIFKLFGRAKTSKKFDGQGIGLSICKEIVENHKGKIWVESKIGKGSAFYFTAKNSVS